MEFEDYLKKELSFGRQICKRIILVGGTGSLNKGLKYNGETE